MNQNSLDFGHPLEIVWGPIQYSEYWQLKGKNSAFTFPLGSKRYFKISQKSYGCRKEFHMKVFPVNKRKKK